MNSTHSSANEVFRGWVGDPSAGRGTLTILVSCGVTLFLCIWTSVCVNLPARKFGSRDIFRDKFHLFLLGVLGPEFVLLLAIGQYCAAKTSVLEFQQSGIKVQLPPSVAQNIASTKSRNQTLERVEPSDVADEIQVSSADSLSRNSGTNDVQTDMVEEKFEDWSLRHAFFANMGGVVLDTPGFPSFPINGKQLHYLVSHKRFNGQPYLKLQHVTRELIDDKNKSDNLARLITVIQLVSFTISTVARIPQHLEIMGLEVTTLGTIFCTLLASYFWREKPMNIQSPLVVKSNISIEEILKDAGFPVTRPYEITPLDFIGREEWEVSRLWKYYCSILFKLFQTIYPIHRPATGLAEKFSSIDFPPLNRNMLPIMLLTGILYSGIFLAKWNSHFPTTAEQELWRVASMGTVIITVVGGTCEYVFALLELDGKKKTATARGMEKRTNTKTLSNLEQGLQRHRTHNTNRDLSRGLSLVSIFIFTPICACYCLLRAFVLIEDLISFRELPASTFETVDWTVYLPHFR